MDGQYRGTIDSPTESVVGEPIDDVRVDDWSVHRVVPSDLGPLALSDVMTAGRISGTVPHGGSARPLSLSKATASYHATRRMCNDFLRRSR
jgi:hypothetical protein